MSEKKSKKVALLFPGQGAQYPGMGKDLIKEFSAARLTFEEADDLLKRPISDIILNGPEELLTQTRNSQLAIYITSIALHRVFQEIGSSTPFVTAGLSLGEYTALTAAEWISFREALPLVQYRAEFMNAACEATAGTMSAVMGLESAVVDRVIEELALSDDLWVANYNCPGQIVISGTHRGIEAATEALKKQGAKRVLPLQVHGAFHSGLMRQAKEKLTPYIEQAPIRQGICPVVMNVSGQSVEALSTVKQNLIDQVTHSVRWEQGIRTMEEMGVDLYIEFGPGKTLSGMNKRIGTKAPVISIEKVDDFKLITL